MSGRPPESTIDTYRQQAGMTSEALWWAYFALGGNATPNAVDRFLSGHTRPGRTDHDLLAHAINEQLTQLGQNSPVPYFHDDELGSSTD